MSSFIFFAFKVFLIVGTVMGSSQIGEDPLDPLNVPIEDSMQPIDEINPAQDVVNENPVEVEDSGVEVEEVLDDYDRNIIDVPRRPCPRCYKRDRRGICRKISDCTRG